MFRFVAATWTAWASAVAVCVLPIVCVEAVGAPAAASSVALVAVWLIVRSTVAPAVASTVFAWLSPSRMPAVTMLTFDGRVWVACAVAVARCAVETTWTTSGPAARPASCVWARLAAALAVAAEEFVWVMSGVSCTGAASVAGAAAASAALAGAAAAGVGAVGGSPLHVQLHTQLHEHAWSKLNELVTPFDPVHVHVQIQWPATGATETAGLALAPVAPVAACVATHVQSHVSDPVGASGGVGTVPSVQTQFQTHGSLPVGTTTPAPGRTTDTLTLLAPLTVALAEVPFASTVFVCVGTSSCPGLPTRTEMFTFVGLVCAAVAV